jgi:hypothetical protein
MGISPMFALPPKADIRWSRQAACPLCAKKQTLRVDNTRGGVAPIVEPDDQVRVRGWGSSRPF